MAIARRPMRSSIASRRRTASPSPASASARRRRRSPPIASGSSRRIVADGRPEAAGRAMRAQHNIALAEAQAIDHGDSVDARAGADARVRSGLTRRAQLEACRQQVEIEAHADGAATPTSEATQTIAGAARPVRRAARDRRAEDADPHLRRLRHRRRPGADDRARHDGGGGAHQPLRAEARQRSCSTSPTRARRSTRSAIARRGPKGSRRSPARRAARCSPSPAPAQRCSSGSSRSCPATTCSASSRTRATRTASRTRSASTCRARGAIVRSRRQLLNAASRSRRRRGTPRAGGRGRAELAAARRRRCRCASRRSRCRGRSATRCSC